ncbi:MAG TPA: anaerobic ribonucleoside-triphosphate reductase, partial [bacterium]|nr:anaerobic ribonucleoside-triphosphate reductase [bacterium]
TAALLVKKISYNYKLPYFTISPTYTICNKCGYFAGEHENCPTCGAKAEVYSRITGYYRPIEHWNEGKKQEFEKRKEYEVEREKMSRMSDSANPTVKRGKKPVSSQESLFSMAEAKEETHGATSYGVSPESMINPGFGIGRIDPEIRFAQRVMLFTTKSCPNCPKAKDEMKGVLDFEIIDAEENMDISRKYGIRSVPSVVVEEKGAYRTYTGISNIIKYKKELEGLKV